MTMPKTTGAMKSAATPRRGTRMGRWSLAPGNALRFVERDGKRILQQAWIKSWLLSGEWSSGEHEWRDVPLVDEAAPEDVSIWSEGGYT